MLNKQFSYVMLLLGGLVFLSSCENYKRKYRETNEKNLQLETELKRLEEEGKLVRGDYNEAIDALNSIDDTLRIIGERQRIIDKLKTDSELSGTASQRAKVISRIDGLAKANAESQQRAKNLQAEVKKLKVDNEGLKNMMSQFEKRIAEQEVVIAENAKEIEALKGEVGTLKTEVQTKTQELTATNEQLKDQTDRLDRTSQQLNQTLADLNDKNTFIDDCAKAYIACGTKKALRKNDILADLNLKLGKDYRTKVQAIGGEFNFYANNQISCDGGSIETVLPARPKESYKIEGSSLKITDAKKFWSVDKVVVLVKKD